MKTETHYETFTNRLAKYRVHAKKAIEFLRNRDKTLNQGDTSDKWIHGMVHYDAKIGLPNGKEHNFIPKRIAGDFEPFLNAFVLELHNYWFSKFEPDPTKPLSYQTSRITEPMILAQEINNAVCDKTTTMLQYQVLSHERAGRRVYEVSEGLSAKLQHTELRGLTCEDLRLPFPSVYITVPANTGFKVYNHLTGWHDVIGVYITEDKQAKKAKPGNRVTCRLNKKTKEQDLLIHDPEGNPQTEFPITREWCIMIVGKSKSDKFMDDALYWFDLTLLDEDDLDGCISRVIHNYALDNKELASKVSEASMRAFDEMSDVWTVIFRWCINVIVYATYSEPGELAYNDPVARQLWQKIEKMPASRKRQNLINRFKSLGTQERRYLGKNIVVDRDRELMERAGTGRHNAITVRTLVCGHWRRVPYGPGKQLRRTTFIEPFWRGPDDGTKLSKTHVLK